MNAVEIEEAVSALAARPFDPAQFPYAFLTAFGNKDTTIKRLRAGNTNASDIPGGVLQRNHIHIAVCGDGMVSKTMTMLRKSPKTLAAKAKFIVATDGVSLEAEDLITGEPLACAYRDIAEHFGVFLPLAGISTVKEIKNNPFDVKATGKLNKLYVELLRDNPDWATEEKRPALNQFIARLIFCFFAEDTGIFLPKQFTKMLEQMSDGQSGNTHEVLCELFRSMDLKSEDREAAKVKSWASKFPYVNGGMFAGGGDCPKFSRIARSYLLAVGALEWDKINPDIFGSMIQAVADDEERGELGMHYTSVPNILKVLNPLFLDDLREQLRGAGDNPRKLRNLRRRLSSIRVFDPACGSGNFLVIAYKEMRAIENEIVRRLDDAPKSWIRLENFYGIEIKTFAVEIARLALLIAEFQCDVQFISQQEARAMVLPLHRTGTIAVANALRVNWGDICPHTTVRSRTAQEEEDQRFPSATDDESSETYICGNPPYLGAKKKNADQVADMEAVGLSDSKLLDYVCAFMIKGLAYLNAQSRARMALVATSSVCQGEQVSLLWPRILETAHIAFAYRPFRWSNSAAHNAGVFCTIVGIQPERPSKRLLFSGDQQKECTEISPYLIEGPAIICKPTKTSISGLAPMVMGSNAVDGKRLILERDEATKLIEADKSISEFIRGYGGTEELSAGVDRFCIWIDDQDLSRAQEKPLLAKKIDACRSYREGAGRDARKAAKRPHAFCYSTFQNEPFVQVGNTIGNRYEYVPLGLRPAGFVSNHNAFAIYGVHLVEVALVLSRMHLVWAEAIAGRLGNGVRYGNTVVYNTFPVPLLTSQNRSELSRTASDILLTREALFPATIGDLYDREDGEMPSELRRAHDANDELVERIYIGRRFRNDTERLERLFELYSKLAAENPISKKKAKRVA
ncbi:class I SAM-dependent DNA methyltransferase [Bradyrhizobium diazoefficiens]|uniref:class I SAM-dependent DNA methyltransferase n=1 Tax=Bradyrhizobium diazoefficiens TaxID=1355477 RepID=UPI001B54CC5D|nr:hypothetical protein [Bradyrhizobium japonicum]